MSLRVPLEVRAVAHHARPLESHHILAGKQTQEGGGIYTPESVLYMDAIFFC